VCATSLFFLGFLIVAYVHPKMLRLDVGFAANAEGRCCVDSWRFYNCFLNGATFL
jgi:hypothetical protein